MAAFVIVAGFFLVCFDRHSNSEDGSLFNVCLPDATRQRLAGFWILSMNLWECCPCGLHSVISRLLAGGSLGFRIVHLLFLAHRLLSGTLWFVVRSCFTLPYQSLRWYNVVISSCIFQLSRNWSADHRPCWFLFLLWFVWIFWCFCLFYLFLGFGVCFLSCTVTAQWIMYRSNSVLFCITLSLWLMLPLH